MTSNLPRNCGQTYIVNFGICAPGPAASDADFEFSREIIEVSVTDEEFIGLKSERRGVEDLVGIDPSEWATGDVPSVVTAGARRGKSRSPQFVESFGEVFNRNPMKLNVLTYG